MEETWILGQMVQSHSLSGVRAITCSYNGPYEYVFRVFDWFDKESIAELFVADEVIDPVYDDHEKLKCACRAIAERLDWTIRTRPRL